MPRQWEKEGQIPLRGENPCLPQPRFVLCLKTAHFDSFFMFSPMKNGTGRVRLPDKASSARRSLPCRKENNAMKSKSYLQLEIDTELKNAYLFQEYLREKIEKILDDIGKIQDRLTL